MVKKKKKKRKSEKDKRIAIIIYNSTGRRKLLLLDPSMKVRKKIHYTYRKEKGKLIYYFDVPGVKEKDVKIKISGKRLKVKVNTKEYIYYRTVTLPQEPRGKLKKSLINGILELQIPI